MNMQHAREGFYSHSGRASDVARQLGFAGLALIWIFRTGADARSGFALPEALLLPAFLIVVTLACDFLQYVSATIAWGMFIRWKERQPGWAPNQDFDAPRWINWPHLTFFTVKLGTIAAAYCYLLSYLLQQFGGNGA